MTDPEKHRALFGVPVTVRFQPTDAELAKYKPEDGEFKFKEEAIKVREMSPGLYDLAASWLERGDEVKFTGIAIGRDLAWLSSLTAESYNALATAVQEVNPDFFAYYGRRFGRKEGMRRAIEQISAGASAPLKN